MRKFIGLCILIMLLGTAGSTLYAQDIFKRNPSELKVDMLSDADIMKFQQQLKANNLTMEEAELLALQRGFQQSEIDKLKQRIEDLNAKGSNLKQHSETKKDADEPEEEDLDSKLFSARNKTTSREYNKPDEKMVKNKTDQLVFGSELFSTSSLTFQPDLRIATPMNYELGPDDELQLTVYGVQEANHNLKISPEGNVSVPYVGVIKLAGLTVEAATTRLRQAMASTAYRSLNTGASKLSVNLSKIRSIRVTVIGANRPGTYTVSSLSTLFNVLYVAGGPAQYGSYRQIELVRNNKVERKVDLYKFLMTGSMEDNVRLRDNDIIRIPTIKTRVRIDGEIKRPGLFEVVTDESINDVLKYAQGFTDSAYKASVHLTRLTDKERKVLDVEAGEFVSFHLKSGDSISVGKIINRYTNRISIEGAVFRPGFYALTPGLTVGELIAKANGLREDAYTIRGQVVRTKDDLTREIIPFDVKNAVNRSGADDILLKREDIVLIRSIFNLREEYFLSMQGEVRNPGVFAYVDSIHLKDALVLAGGFTEAAYPQRIEVSRLIKRDTLTQEDIRSSEIIETSTGGNLAPGDDIVLRPFDVVTVRRKPGFTPLQTVFVSGQVQYPGPYVIASRNEHVSDLLKRAGGFTPEAYLEGAYLKRFINKERASDIKIKQIDKIQEQLKDTSSRLITELTRTFDQIPLDLTKIMSNPGIPEDIQIQENDEIYVPKFDAQVRVNGQVLFPTQVPFAPDDRLKDYVNAAGGFTENAVKRKVYVLYANGKAASTRNYVFFKSYPKIKPGSEIIVPKSTSGLRQKRSPQENIALASAIASLAGVVIALTNLLRN